jgi:nitroreductase
MKRASVLVFVALIFTFCQISVVYSEGGSDTPETIAILLESRAHRTFLDEPVSPEDLETIVQCGIQAPSARNDQPWHFTVVTNREIASRIVGGTNGAVIVISGSERGISTEFDCGLATQAMYTAAQALGLGANIYLMPVAQVNAAMRDELAIPDGYQAVMIMSVGHIDTDAVSSASPRGSTEKLVDYIE